MMALGGEELLILSFPVGEFSIPDSLSEAEREVLHLLLEGASHAEIARARQTAVRTVCNQVASIYRKTQVSSRMELALKLRKPLARR
jgi:DNA-binding NarL/FixJ family response regulator